MRTFALVALFFLAGCWPGLLSQQPLIPPIQQPTPPSGPSGPMDVSRNGFTNFRFYNKTSHEIYPSLSHFCWALDVDVKPIPPGKHDYGHNAQYLQDKCGIVGGAPLEVTWGSTYPPNFGCQMQIYDNESAELPLARYEMVNEAFTCQYKVVVLPSKVKINEISVYEASF